MRRTPLTLALAFAGALAFAAIAGAQTDQAGGGQAGGQPATGGQTGSGGQMGSGGQVPSGGGQGGDKTNPPDSRSAQAANKGNSDQKYLDQVAVGNLTEIQLSQLAVQNAQDPQVKQFAQNMVDAHTKANEQLQQVASAAGVSLPTELDTKHQKLQSKLSGLNGQSFDREYVKLMVSSHKEMEGLLKKRAGKEASASASGASGGYGTTTGSTSGAAGTSGSTTGTSGTTGATGSTGTTGSTVSSGGGVDAQVSNLASSLLPEVQQHLQQAKDLEKQLNQAGKSNKNAPDSVK